MSRFAGGHTYSQNRVSGGNVQFGDNHYGDNYYAAQVGPKVSFFRTSAYEAGKNANASRLPDTCKWILRHQHFVQWQQSDHDDVLWVTAPPGCGKSVLAKALVDERLSATTETVRIVYYFFKDNGEQNSSTGALCAILHQLFSGQRSLELFNRYAVPAIDADGDHLKTNFDALWNLLLESTKDETNTGTICVLDALDECRESDRQGLISKLEEFRFNTDSSTSWLKFVVTSRPYQDIEEGFFSLLDRFPNTHLTGEPQDITADINHTIDLKVTELAKQRKIPQEVQKAIKDKLLNVPHRTYLWLTLVWDEIKGSLAHTLPQINAILDNLPLSVEQAYEKLLSRCANQESAREILQIIVGALRPLSVQEMDYLLALSEDVASSKDLEPQIEGIEQRAQSIQQLCGLFVIIVDGLVYLLHQTAKEFLLQKPISEPDAIKANRWKASINAIASFHDLAQRCVRYLMLDDFNEPWLKLSEKGKWKPSPKESQFFKMHPLIRYAACSWTIHFNASLLDADNPLSRKARTLVDTSSHRFRTWYRIVWSASSRSPPKHYTDLSEAASFDLLPVMEVILQEGVDINIRDGDGDTPLHSACMHKRVRAAKFLISHGASWTVRANDGNVALSTAAAFGVSEVVELLLSLGADPNVRNNDEQTPLHRACQFGHRPTAELLLNTGHADHRVTDKNGLTPELYDRMFDINLFSLSGSNSNLRQTRVKFEQ